MLQCVSAILFSTDTSRLTQNSLAVRSDDRRRRRLPDVEDVLLVVQDEEPVAADGEVADGPTAAAAPQRRRQHVVGAAEHRDGVAGRREQLAAVRRQLRVARLLAAARLLLPAARHQLAPAAPPHAAGVLPEVEEAEVLVLVDQADRPAVIHHDGVDRALLLERGRRAGIGPRPDDAPVPEVEEAEEGGVRFGEHGGHHERAGVGQPLQPVGVAQRAARRLVAEASLRAGGGVPDADAVLVEPALAACEDAGSPVELQRAGGEGPGLAVVRDAEAVAQLARERGERGHPAAVAPLPCGKD
jgi:hypothetical protein